MFRIQNFSNSASLGYLNGFFRMTRSIDFCAFANGSNIVFAQSPQTMDGYSMNVTHIAL